MKSMVRDFVGRVFDGSAKPLLEHLAEDRRLSKVVETRPCPR